MQITGSLDHRMIYLDGPSSLFWRLGDWTRPSRSPFQSKRVRGHILGSETHQSTRENRPVVSYHWSGTALGRRTGVPSEDVLGVTESEGTDGTLGWTCPRGGGLVGKEGETKQTSTAVVQTWAVSENTGPFLGRNQRPVEAGRVGEGTTSTGDCLQA